MNYSTDQLKEKIGGFHPELAKNGVSLTVDWDVAGKRFAFKLGKAGKTVGAYLDQKYADECMSGKKCLNLAVLVTQLLADLEDLITPRKPG
jgi:5S rRNA maturation endonuclease (ribonuclease M5)